MINIPKISTTPTNGALNEGYSIPIFAKAAYAEAFLEQEFLNPFREKDPPDQGADQQRGLGRGGSEHPLRQRHSGSPGERI